jgi:hypothetical protein
VRQQRRHSGCVGRGVVKLRRAGLPILGPIPILSFGVTLRNPVGEEPLVNVVIDGVCQAFGMRQSSNVSRSCLEHAQRKAHNESASPVNKHHRHKSKLSFPHKKKPHDEKARDKCGIQVSSETLRGRTKEMPARRTGFALFGACRFVDDTDRGGRRSAFTSKGARTFGSELAMRRTLVTPGDFGLSSNME